ncbi:cadherin-like beta sandwich domain-containing protein, partial [Tumebacillus sp. ITR2]
ALTPNFDSGTPTYTVSVGNAVTNLTVTPTVSNSHATVKVGTEDVTSGSASSPIALSVGSNVISVTVKAENGDTQTYSLTVTRAAAPLSSDATLSNLTVSQGALTPNFDSGTPTYTVSVGNAVTNLTVTPTVSDSHATVKVGTEDVTSGNASSPIALSVGSNVISVTVKAENGDTQTYSLTVTRAAAPLSSDATLSNLTVSQGTLTPNFDSGKTSYTVHVGNVVNSLTLTPTLAEAQATVLVNGVAVISGQASAPISLNVGSNTLTVVVTAQDGSTQKTYTLTVIRAGGSTPSTGTVTVVVTGGSSTGSTIQDMTQKLGTNLNVSATIYGADGKPLNLSDIPVKNDGTFQMPNVQTGTYHMVLNVIAPTGEKLAGQPATLTVDSNHAAKIQTELIDPFGIVRDSITHQPIDGVKTTLYWADTQLNRDKGRTPNTPVNLPELSNMAPNQNHNPQITRDGGQYGWMVFPDGDYYMVAQRDGYVVYDSRQDLRDEQQGDTSFIRNGLIHVGQTIVQMNYDMEPKAVREGVHQPYIYGYPNGTFGPDNQITRAELAAILARILPDGTNSATVPSFQDLQATHWAYNSIAKVFGLKIMVGNPDGTFRPDDVVTRAEMAVVIAKLKQLPTALDTDFSDIGGHWAQAFIAQAEQSGYVTGYPDHTYRPDQAITRAETVVIMNRVLQRHVQHVDTPSIWSDVPSTFWGYADIMEASQSHDYQVLQDGSEVWKK